MRKPTNSIAVTQFWRIAPSEASVDREYVEKDFFTKSFIADGPGCGLWCAREGEHTIYFGADGDSGSH